MGPAPPLVALLAVKLMVVLVAVSSLSRAARAASVIPGGFTVYNATNLSALVGAEGPAGGPSLHPLTRDALL